MGVQILSRNKAISYLNSCNSAISFPRNGMINQKVCKNNSNELNTRIHKMAADGEYKKRRDTWRGQFFKRRTVTVIHNNFFSTQGQIWTSTPSFYSPFAF